MKASVQYDDLKGTAAADVSDFHQSSLQNYLVDSYEQYDGDRYECYGCSIFISRQQIQPQGNIVFVCKLVRNENKKLDSRRKLFKILNKFNMPKEQKIIKTFAISPINTAKK